MLARILLLALAVASAGQAQPDADKFKLGNRCMPVGLAVIVPGDEQQETLAESAARTMLDVSGLYLSEETVVKLADAGLPAPMLIINVLDLGSMAIIRAKFARYLTDPMDRTAGMAITWEDVTVIDGRDFKSGVVELTLEFVSEYKRVNYEHCAD
ncbi:MAG: hypothetical protein OXH83_16960 [Bryobacterales bacterium]|nr:hypothetical protein [Bryobacterales bacterium]